LSIKKALNINNIKGNKMSVAEQLKAEAQLAEKLAKQFQKAAKKEYRP
jgi:hypothetical protein